jgi:hypothetical protein
MKRVGRLSRKALAAMFPLTADEVRKFHQIADSVWNHIGYDVLQAVAESNGRDADRTRMRLWARAHKK